MMNARLDPDDMQEYRDQAARDWQRYKEASKPITTTWKPVMTEQQKQEHDEYVRINDLQF